jgi:hypothetical protein
MKKKLFIDLILFILIMLLMQYDFTGGLLHEIIGILMLSFFIIHVMFNKKWLHSIKNNFNKIKTSNKINYILDILSIISFIICTISGILISKYIFNFTYISIFDNIHSISSYILFLLITLHILLHFNQIINYITNNFNNKEDKLIFKYSSLVLFLFLVFLGFKNSLFKNNNEVSNNDTNKSSTSFKSSSNNSSSNSNSNSNSSGSTPTLQQYLSTLHCGQCHNNCLLSAIKCDRGSSKKEAATEEYYELYTTSMTMEESNTIISSDGNYEIDI